MLTKLFSIIIFKVAPNWSFPLRWTRHLYRLPFCEAIYNEQELSGKFLLHMTVYVGISGIVCLSRVYNNSLPGFLTIVILIEGRVVLITLRFHRSVFHHLVLLMSLFTEKKIKKIKSKSEIYLGCSNVPFYGLSQYFRWFSVYIEL